VFLKVLGGPLFHDTLLSIFIFSVAKEQSTVYCRTWQRRWRQRQTNRLPEITNISAFQSSAHKNQ